MTIRDVLWVCLRAVMRPRRRSSVRAALPESEAARERRRAKWGCIQPPRRP